MKTAADLLLIYQTYLRKLLCCRFIFEDLNSLVEVKIIWVFSWRGPTGRWLQTPVPVRTLRAEGPTQVLSDVRRGQNSSAHSSQQQLTGVQHPWARCPLPPAPRHEQHQLF